MIILSGVLVVLAIALLIVGIAFSNSGIEVVGLDGLMLIYISMAISILSALCLTIGVILRRKELLGTPPSSTGRTATESKKARKTTGDTAPEPQDTPTIAPLPVEVPGDALVFVVRGRKRYHLDNCRQLVGRHKDELTYAEAQEEGFSPCTACMPDTALAARAAVSTGKETAGAAAKQQVTQASSGGDRQHHPTGSARSARTEASRRGTDPERARRDMPMADSTVTTDFSAVAPIPEPEDEPRNAHDHEQEREQEREQEHRQKITPEAVTGVPEDTGPDDHSDMVTDASTTETAHDQAAQPAERSAEDASWAQLSEPKAAEQRSEPMPPSPPVTVAAGEDGSGDGPHVRILSGTKRYHRPDCALIEDIGDDDEDLETLPLPEAMTRGCTPCLVCEPDKEHAHD